MQWESSRVAIYKTLGPIENDLRRQWVHKRIVKHPSPSKMRITPMTLHAPQILYIHVHGNRQSGVLVCGFWGESSWTIVKLRSTLASSLDTTVTTFQRTPVKGTSRGPVLDPTSPLGHRRLDLIGQAHAKCVTWPPLRLRLTTSSLSEEAAKFLLRPVMLYFFFSLVIK